MSATLSVTDVVLEDEKQMRMNPSIEPELARATPGRRVRCVGMVISSYTRPYLGKIVRELKARTNCHVILYVRSEAEQRGMLRSADKSDPWDDIVVCEHFSAALRETGIDPTEVVRRAQKYERLIGETFQTLGLDRRQLGRGYSPGGSRTPRDPAVEKADYLQVLHALSTQLSFWERELADKGIDLLIDAPKEAAAMARVCGVAWRLLTFGRVENRYYWSVDEYRNNPQLEASFREIVESRSAAIEKPYVVASIKFNRVESALKFFGAIRMIGLGFLRWCGKTLIGQRPKENRLRDIFVRPLLRSRDYYRYKSITRNAQSRVANTPFVYFPLQKELETSWLVTTPEYTSQHAAIMAVASSLPAGVLLAVKENLIAMGRRPAGFYDQLTDIKNVVLLPLEASSLELQRSAIITACLTGTAAFEAAISGKPVIVFGRHLQIGFLDHVDIVRDHAQIGPFVERVLAGRIDLEKARHDGRRLIQAMRESTFDLGSFVHEKDFDQGRLTELVKPAVDALLASLAARQNAASDAVAG